MKKIVLFIVIVIVGVFIYFYISKDTTLELLDDVYNSEFYITKYSVFGTHLNLDGCIDKDIEGDSTVVLKNKKDEITIESDFNRESGKTCFSLSLIHISEPTRRP